LDLTLIHLLWWDEVDPHDVGQILKPGVTSRVKSLSNYGNRIGGSWDGSTGPIRDWKNAVAHGGRHANSDEVGRAVEATSELYDYLRTLADGEKARRHYPLLISILNAGVEEGLNRRQKKVHAAYCEGPQRSRERFDRYVAICNRERSIAFGNPVDPSTDFADGVAVFSGDTITSWWLFDREAFSVVQTDGLNLAESMVTDLTQEYRRRHPSAVEGHFQFELDKLLSPKRGASWVSADHLPGMDFMCTIAIEFRR
jgi:hypothetical protein